MGETLDALHRLQGVEIKLAALKQGRESKTRLGDTKRRNLKRIEDSLQERQRAIREAQSRVDILTLELTAKEDAVARHREGLNKAKTNKEYAAILAAMNTEKADNTKQETELQKMMEEVQELRNGEKEIQAEFATAQADVGRADGIVSSYDDQVREELTRLTSSRAALAAKVPAHALAIFSKVAERHDGEALAPVVKTHPKRDEFSCSGCNMSVTLDIVNFLTTRDDIRVCQSCGRILYLESAVAQPSPARR